MMHGKSKVTAVLMACVMVFGTVGAFADTGAAGAAGRPRVGKELPKASGAAIAVNTTGAAMRDLMADMARLKPGDAAEEAQRSVEEAENRIGKAVLQSLRAKYATEFATELTQLETLRETAHAKWEAVAAANASIRTELERIREEVRALDRAAGKEVLVDLKAKMETYRTSIETIRNEIRTLQRTKTQAWIKLREAVAADDTTAVKAALDEILSLKAQIIAKLDPLLDAKQTFLTFLKAYVVPTGTSIATGVTTPAGIGLRRGGEGHPQVTTPAGFGFPNGIPFQQNGERKSGGRL